MYRLLLLLLLLPLLAPAQKKPLDHTVYDSWESFGERHISGDGKWVVYTITPQEGDARLYLQATDSEWKMEVPRGYNAVITGDSRFALFRIRPLYREIREARIKKKRPEDFPKDSLAIVELGKVGLWKTPKVKSFRTPKEGSGWVAYHRDADPAALKAAGAPTQKTVDSLRKTIDSLVLLVRELKNVKGGSGDEADADEEGGGSSTAAPASDLVLRQLATGREVVFKGVSEYQFDEGGRQLLLKGAGPGRTAFERNVVVLYQLAQGRADTVFRGAREIRNIQLSRDGSRSAFLASTDTGKTAPKFYGLYVYEKGAETARLLVERKSVGMQVGMTVSENAVPYFSRSGQRLFFGTAYMAPPKDTTLVDIDLVKLDIWHYKDEYLQSQQLSRLANDLKQTYLALFDFEREAVLQLASRELPNIFPTAEGDGRIFYGVTDTGRRVEAQWTGSTRKDIYAIDAVTGRFRLVRRNHEGGGVYPSYNGKYLLVFDQKTRQYLVWNGKDWKTATAGIKTPLYNEEHDTPGDPAPYGIARWFAGDSAVLVYDRYDVWKVDPSGVQKPEVLLGGRKERLVYRYVPVDAEEQYLRQGQMLVFREFNERTKGAGYREVYLNEKGRLASTSGWIAADSAYALSSLQRARNSAAYLFTSEQFRSSPTLYWNRGFYPSDSALNQTNSVAAKPVALAKTNPQQEEYNWGTAELFTWKTFNGKTSEGILYKPEDFDSTRKYPMIIYFYERLSDGLHTYQPPAPTPSRLNIPFFVSRGYLVFAPDIRYTKGHPARDAYNYIVAGAQALAKKKWVDSKNIGIQGQSWGGYQVVALLVQTGMFKAAWAGAPVANMFSAYGGIRWEGGVNRQFQYEKGQSRIGATPWEQPQLYIENSPFFHLPKVTTPLVIMSNDADGAVPWYQGIELFTALRRLDKPVWMLNYNGEAHNLVERKNRKDIQIRQQQFFDWLLKGAAAAPWITEGVPAVKKGREWGL